MKHRRFPKNLPPGAPPTNYFNARWYDPELGRFTTEDPVKDGGNWYAYVGNRPLVLTDPSGLDGMDLDEAKKETGQDPKEWMDKAGKDTYDVGDTLAETDVPPVYSPTVGDIAKGVLQGTELVLGAAGWVGDTFIPGFAEGRKAFDSAVDGNYVEAGEHVVTGAAEVGIAYMGGKMVSALLAKIFPLANPPINAGPVAEAPAAAAGSETTTVIGRVKDLQELAPGEKSLLDRLPDLGSPKANWKQNAGVLRQEMSKGLPILDKSPGDTAGQFLNAERILLQGRGWTFDSPTNLWNPPVGGAR